MYWHNLYNIIYAHKVTRRVSIRHGRDALCLPYLPTIWYHTRVVIISCRKASVIAMSVWPGKFYPSALLIRRRIGPPKYHYLLKHQSFVSSSPVTYLHLFFGAWCPAPQSSRALVWVLSPLLFVPGSYPGQQIPASLPTQVPAEGHASGPGLGRPSGAAHPSLGSCQWGEPPLILSKEFSRHTMLTYIHSRWSGSEKKIGEGGHW